MTTNLARRIALVAVAAAGGGCLTSQVGGDDRTPGDDSAQPDAAPAPCDAIETVVGDKTITDAADLADLPSGCWALTGRLAISGASVTTAARIGDLRQVGGLELGGTGLTSLDLPHALEVSGAISIHDNPQLASVAKLSPTTSLASLVIERNAALTGFDGLARVAAVTGEVRIADNARLASIDLAGLHAVGALTIRGNAALVSIGSGAALEYVYGTLAIDGNPALTSLGQLGPTAVYQDLEISGNLALHDLGAIAHTQYVDGTARITGNRQLDYCPAREVTCCVDAAAVTIVDNMTTSCTGPHSWCWTEEYGCPFGN